jgi:FG-GAP-like repeat
MLTPKRWTLAAVLFLSLPLAAWAQLVQQIPYPLPPQVKFTIATVAESLDRIADVDGDGKPDLIVGRPCVEVSCTNPAVQLRSGANGALIAQVTGGIGFGTSVAAIPDVTGDGLEDVLVGDTGNGRGFVYASPGLSFVTSWAAFTPGSVALYGFAVESAGDVNFDGDPEVLIGAPLYNDGVTDAGLVELVDIIPTPTLVTAIPGPTAWDNFGESIVNLGDLNIDGRQDFAVGGARFGAPAGTICQAPGRVRVYAGGVSPTQLTQLDGAAAGDFFGWSAGALRDLTGDGRRELAVGAIDVCAQSVQSAYVYATSFGGAVQPPLLSLTTPVNGCLAYGWRLAPTGDWNADGTSDFLVSAPDASGTAHPSCPAGQRGRLLVHSGATGAVLYNISPTNASLLYGFAVTDLQRRKFAVADPGAGLIFVY